MTTYNEMVEFLEDGYNEEDMRSVTEVDSRDAIALLRELYDEHDGDRMKTTIAFGEAIEYDKRLTNAVIRDVTREIARRAMN
jgi:hypothetical protein